MHCRNIKYECSFKINITHQQLNFEKNKRIKMQLVAKRKKKVRTIEIYLAVVEKMKYKY